MIIKLTKTKEVKKGNYEYMRIIGEKNDGSTYEKDFFKYTHSGDYTELYNKLTEFAPGEFLNLSYDESKYKNLKDIKGADGFSKQTTNKSSKKENNDNSGDRGNSRGGDYNRSSSIYLAKDIAFRCLPEDADIGDVLKEMFIIASEINKYIEDGVNPSILTGLETPKLKEEK
jgi:hypothetical protein